MAVVEKREDPDIGGMSAADLARGVLLPAAAVLVAVFASTALPGGAWLSEWRTGLLFSLSVLTIVGGQAFLSQYFEVRALRASLLRRIADRKAAAGAFAKFLDGAERPPAN